MQITLRCTGWAGPAGLSRKRLVRPGTRKLSLKSRALDRHPAQATAYLPGAFSLPAPHVTVRKRGLVTGSSPAGHSLGELRRICDPLP